MKLLFLDTETTGTDLHKHCVHQLSGAIVIDNKIQEVFDIKFRPKEGAEIDQGALEATHLTKEELFSRELSYEQGYQCFLKILDKYINKYVKTDKFFLSGYNVHFDKDFTYKLFVDNNNNFWFSYIWGNHIDVMVLATTYLLNQRQLMKDFKQGTVAKYLGFKIDEEKLHDALFDIYVCIGIYCYLTKEKFETLDTSFNYSTDIFNDVMLQEFSNPQETLYKKSLDNIINFGKHKGKSIGQLLIENPGYLVWVFEECKNQTVVSEQIYKEAKEKFQVFLDSKNNKINNCQCNKVIDHQLDNYLCSGFDNDY